MSTIYRKFFELNFKNIVKNKKPPLRSGIKEINSLETAALIISIISLVSSIATATGALYHFLKSKNDSKFRFHFTCQPYEKNNALFCDLHFINSSLEPYSVLRIDFLFGGNIQFIDLSELQERLSNTLVPPREVVTLRGLPLAFTVDEYISINNDKNALKCIKVFTTKRNEPYCIHLRSGLDDSVQKAE